MLEELEIALEPDKAKPQVGQLSDLGLVELTRHRQGQSLSEIFTKKCPHCQGTGCSVIDFNFATPTAEGEYRAKAAKLKLPVSNFKKNNNNKQKPQTEETPVEITEQIPTPEIEVENPSTVAVQEVEKADKKRRGRKTRFDKKKADQVETPLAVTDEIHTAETVLKVNEEIKPEISEELIEAKAAAAEKQAETVPAAEPAEEPVIAQDAATEQPQEEVNEEKPKRTRRPNRGASKRTRSTRSKKASTSEEEVEIQEV